MEDSNNNKSMTESVSHLSTLLQRDSGDFFKASTRNSSIDIFNFNLSQAVLILEEHVLGEHLFEGSTKTALLGGYIFLILSGVCTNLLVSTLIVSNPRLRAARNLLVVNLSLADLMLCLFCMPFTLVDLLNRKWNLGVFLCRCVPFVQGVSIFVSSATVSAIAIDRQHVIINFGGRNAGKNQLERNDVLLYTSILWGLSILLSLPIIFSKRVTTVSLAGLILYDKCIEQWPSQHAKALYTVLILIAQFVIPSIVLTVTHFRIKSYLNRSVRKHDARNSPRTSERLKKELRRNNRATVVLSFISVVFAISWLPWNAFNLMADFDLLSTMPADDFSLAFALCHLVAMTSGVTNPILYGWFNSNIRKEMLHVRQKTVDYVMGSNKNENGSLHCENTYIRSTVKAVVEESQI